MDPLALLCNLHADGAASLERLQRADCRDLGAIEALRELELAALLGEGPAFARRFQREAALLRARLGVDLLEAVEEEEAPRAVEKPAVAASPAAPPPPRTRTPRGTHSEAKAAAKPSSAPKGSELGRRELYAGKPLMGAVLDAWRARDLVDPPPAVQAPTAGAHAGSGVDALLPGQIEGLGRAELAALARGGCTGRRALLAAEAPALARASGLALTRVLRWQFLARRALAASTSAAASASAAPATSAAAPSSSVAPAASASAPSEPTDAGALDASGPFA